MSEISNADRAWLGFFALSEFVKRTDADTARDGIADLVTDLLHLAQFCGLDPDKLAADAARTMATEVDEDSLGDMHGVQVALGSLFANG